jgi:hypothetical protein
VLSGGGTTTVLSARPDDYNAAAISQQEVVDGLAGR